MLPCRPKSAAFGRLRVETFFNTLNVKITVNQPPSGGCVLKPTRVFCHISLRHQPPSGGCVLKP